MLHTYNFSLAFTEMKHFLLFTLVIFPLSFSAFAQTAQGSKFIGGSFQITTESTAENSNTSFDISPKFGYFIQDQWAIGSGVGLSIRTHEETTVFFSLSPFTRYYIPIVENQFFIFGEAAINAGFGHDVSRFGFSVAPGFAFFPSERWCVELGFSLLDFSTYNPKRGNNNTTNFAFGISTFSPSVGVNFFF